MWYASSGFSFPSWHVWKKHKDNDLAVYLLTIFCDAANQAHHTLGVPETLLRKGGGVLLSLAAAFAVSAAPAMAEIRLPPIDNGTYLLKASLL